MYSRIDVHLWVIDQCHAKPWGPCISTGSYCPKVYLWSSKAYWRELPCARGSERPHSAVPEISADQCPALINWYLDEYWSLWHILGIIQKVFLRAFRLILDSGNRASICGVMAKWSLWHYSPSWFELRWEVILFLVYSEDTPAAFHLHFVSFLQVPMCRLLECILSIWQGIRFFHVFVVNQEPVLLPILPGPISRSVVG